MTNIRSLHGTTVTEIFSASLDNMERIDTVIAGRSNTTTANLALPVPAIVE